MIQRMIDDDAAMKAQECADAVEQVNSGEPPRKGDIVGDLEALRKLVEEWCPPQFAKKLR